MYTAIIHLREPTARSQRGMLEPLLRLARGVKHVHFEPAESLITVHFDAEKTGLADLVRLIEDFGPPVAGVAQRRTARGSGKSPACGSGSSRRFRSHL